MLLARMCGSMSKLSMSGLTVNTALQGHHLEETFIGQG